jgi:hypothetical protein
LAKVVGRKRSIPGIALFLGGLLTVGWAFGSFQPVLHEQFDPDPKEDVEFGVRVTSSALPAALQTKNGVLPIPDPSKPPQPKEPTYKDVRSSSTPELRMDNATSDPGRLSYHEPFRPSIAPFKRTHAFDQVTPAFTLTVSDTRPRPVTFDSMPTGTMDQFFADLVIELNPGQSVTIPTVGPQMHVFSAHLEPAASFGFYVDRAENWLIRAPSAKGPARLIMHVGIEPAAFQGQVTAASYSALVKELPIVPENVRQVTESLFAKIGVSRVMPPAEAVARLVTYFRSFSQSTDRPDAPTGEPLYRELVISRKGVCRHRAYAFVVTALGFGIPARFVHNEAHAWVEVFGGTLWQRIDLGGAASGFDYRGEPPIGKPYTPPLDPYNWPQKTPKTEEALPPPQAALNGQGTSLSRRNSSEASRVTLQEPLSTSETRSSESRLDEAPLSGKLTVSVGTITQVNRSQSLPVTGSVNSAKRGCENVRVDVALVQNNQRFAVTTAMTDADGRFSTRFLIPSQMPVGKYELVAASFATKTCPAASN